jgi:hypothetical protein
MGIIIMKSEPSLFTDIEDEKIRNRNRGVVMLNIYEDHCKGSIVPAAGISSIIGYFKQIPDEERQDALSVFTQLCGDKGYLDAVVAH